MTLEDIQQGVIQELQARLNKSRQLNEQLQSSHALRLKEVDRERALRRATSAENDVVRDELRRVKYRLKQVEAQGASVSRIAYLENLLDYMTDQCAQLATEARHQKARADQHKARYYKVVHGVHIHIER